MRLMHARTRKLEDFIGSTVPEYAILSHTWESEEVLYHDVETKDESKLCELKGWYKVVQCCQQALEDDIDYVWIDTCAIDKSSSADLSESINSMFAWYQNAKICYSYLSDYVGDLSKCRWWSRGWTLQELLAPKQVEFFGQPAVAEGRWVPLGSRSFLCDEVVRVTGIPAPYLKGPGKIESASIAQRMSWASRRQTTRVEDTAYCLLGIFGVNMPLLYGEGQRAFLRLQEEIIKSSTDQSIFVWGKMLSEDNVGLRAVCEKNPDSKHYVYLAAKTGEDARWTLHCGVRRRLMKDQNTSDLRLAPSICLSCSPARLETSRSLGTLLHTKAVADRRIK